jgi:hypothetical protein
VGCSIWRDSTIYPLSKAFTQKGAAPRLLIPIEVSCLLLVLGIHTD